MNHSPLPWHCFTDRDVNTGYERKGIATESGWGLCEAQDRDDAAFIVHACNNFERLLAAAKDATAFFIPVDEMYRRLRVLTELITAIEEEAR